MNTTSFRNMKFLSRLLLATHSYYSMEISVHKLQWLSTCTLKRLECITFPLPVKSAYLNLINNVWDMLERNERGRKYNPSTLRELSDKLTQESNNISQDVNIRIVSNSIETKLIVCSSVSS